MPTSEDYDIGEAFEAIENELISSMIRNMKRHKVEEADEEKQWEMWQALQLEALEKYKKDNAKKYGRQFKDINRKIESLIRMANREGMMDQETEILKRIKDGFKGLKKASPGATAEFFKLNDRKLNALIKATTSDMEKAERAILRMSNDKYRKVIYNAQVYANTGAGTYEKAVDMATKDFLSAGINCVEYKNGSRHSVQEYASMALRTASKRAYLQGEGTKRQEWGISTVIVNKRGNPCPLCLPFVGKVFIDDVWSGGSRKDGPYPLLSSAMDAGLYHPNCRDSHTTYFPGISTPPDKQTFTEQDIEKAIEVEKAEQKESHARKQEERVERLAKNSLDPDNRRAYQHRADQWEEKVEEAHKEARTFKDEDIINTENTPSFSPAKTIEEAQEFASRFIKPSFMDRIFKGKADFKGISLEHANEINSALNDVFTQFPDLEKLSGIKVVSPNSAQGRKAFKDGADAVFAYDPIQNGIYINKDVVKNPKAFEEYRKRSSDAWDLVMNNMDKLSPEQRKLAEVYKNAGRELVSGDSIHDLFMHELGHHVQWTMLDAKTNNLVGSKMTQYAPHISGYANANKSEYLAESFVAFMKGEREILDPEYVEYLNNKTPYSIIESLPKEQINAIPVMNFSAVSESKVVETMRKEYATWASELSDEEVHAIHKYTKNSFEKDKNKFYMKLNAMLRGDIPEDENLRYYADTISKAITKKPLENGIICYRNLDMNPFEGVSIGDEVPGTQFFSTSVIRTRVMKGKWHLIIIAPPGTLGSYIESISRVPSQREFLIDKGCRYIIEDIEGNNITLRVIV